MVSVAGSITFKPVFMEEQDVCPNAPDLIEKMLKRLDKLKGIPDPRLRDPLNDLL